MKLKYLILVLASYALFSCNDTLDQIGSVIQPDSDVLSVSNDTFSIESSTVILDSIYAHTNIGLLGKFHDDTYGSLSCDYYGQLRCPDGFALTDYNNKTISSDKFVRSNSSSLLDSATVSFYFDSYVGDSLEPLQVSVYKLKNPQIFAKSANFYSNQSAPAKEELVFWGKKTFIPKSNKNYYMSVRLPIDTCNKIYEMAQDTAKFANYAPGLYLTTNYGSKAILRVKGTSVYLHYTYQTIISDSLDTISTAKPLSIAKDVIQINRYSNSTDDLKKLVEDQSATYIKTPAGVFTQLSIPVGSIADSLESHGAERLNGAKLSFGSFRVENVIHKLQPPKYLLMVKKEQMDSLFNGKLAFDENKHLYATLSAKDNSYEFSNLRTLLNDDLTALATQITAAKKAGNATKLSTLINKKTDVYLVPFTITNTSTSGSITDISHYFAPSAVKLKTKDLKLTIVYAK